MDLEVPPTVPAPRASLKAKREERAGLAIKIRELADRANDGGRDFTAEEKPEWERVNADYDRLTREIDLGQRAEQVERDMAAAPDHPLGRDDSETRDGRGDPNRLRSDAGPSEETRALALQGWCRAQSDLDLTERHVEALAACHINPNQRAYRIPLLIGAHDYRQFRRAARQGRESRALSAFVNTLGGYTVPQGFVTDLELALLQWTQLRGVCDVMRTAEGNDLPWPTVNDTGNKGAILVEAQNVALTEQPLFGQVIFHAYKYTSNLVQVPTELLQDSAFNLAAYLAELLGIRIGRIQADHFTTGSGASQPNGLVNAATLGITTAAPAAIAADELYNLKHSVDPAYRPDAGWMFHDQVLLYLKKLKDGIGRYLWQSSLASGDPDTIDGDPITINQSMANAVASANTTVVYGNFQKYKIRDVAEIRLLKLIERYADQDMTGFVAFMRSDANLLDAATHPVKTLQQHA